MMLLLMSCCGTFVVVVVVAFRLVLVATLRVLLMEQQVWRCLRKFGLAVQQKAREIETRLSKLARLAS